MNRVDYFKEIQKIKGSSDITIVPNTSNKSGYYNNDSLINFILYDYSCDMKPFYETWMSPPFNEMDYVSGNLKLKYNSVDIKNITYIEFSKPGGILPLPERKYNHPNGFASHLSTITEIIFYTGDMELLSIIYDITNKNIFLNYIENYCSNKNIKVTYIDGFKEFQ